MTESNLPAAASYHPATFQERGVAAPFTTPFLGGTRVRAVREQGIELLVRNPTGNRGVYVMSWAGIGSLCRPTLHDKVLSTRIASLESVTPATVRRVASAIAAEGLAGEQAMRTAQSAAKTEDADRRATRHRLLVALVHQVNAVLPIAGGTEATDVDVRAQQTIAWLAPHLHQTPARVAGALDALSGAMVGLGAATDGDVDRVPRMIGMLRQFREEMLAWSKTQRSAERAARADVICAMAGVIVLLTGVALENARQLTDDMVSLLRNWAADPDLVLRVTTRPEWLLDGWEQICLIWNYARDDGTRSAALAEIMEHVPILPTEITERDGRSLDVNNTLLRHRPITLNEDWRTGAMVFDLIARNEQLRSVAS